MSAARTMSSALVVPKVPATESGSKFAEVIIVLRFLSAFS